MVRRHPTRHPPERVTKVATERNQARAKLLRATEAETLELGASTAIFVATGSVTGGEFGLFRWEMEPHAGGARPHVHRTFSESFYVLTGGVRLYDGQGWIDAVPGDFLHVPPGAVHGFANEADASASMLILFCPGAPREEYFRELAALRESGRVLRPKERSEFLARHDQYMV